MNKTADRSGIVLGFVLGLTSMALAAAATVCQASPDAGEGVAPETALAALKAGNERFAKGKPLHLRQDELRRLKIAPKQAPEAILLSCSDSRVPPEIVFDQGLGDLFPVRVAGNVSGSAQVASVEYAVEHLGPRLIVVMGHTACGAVKAAISTPKDGSAGSPDLDALVETIRKHLKPEDFESADKALVVAARHNVDGVADELVHSSKIIEKALADRKIRIVKAIYALDTGKVDFWE